VLITGAAMLAPCSVKASAECRLPPCPELEITICDLKTTWTPRTMRMRSRRVRKAAERRAGYGCLPAKPTAPPLAGRKAILYTMGKSKTIELILPVATPAELRSMVKLSRASRQRVDRAIAKAGLRRKSG